jgi:hypothetical protein
MLTAKFGSIYADDSTLSLADDENSLNEALNMISLFSSPDPKGHVRYCHHLASVVRPFSIFGNSGHVCWPNGIK